MSGQISGHGLAITAFARDRFRFNGRLSRIAFWLRYLEVCFGFLLITIVASLFSSGSASVRLVADLGHSVLSIGLSAVLFLAMVRRLRDAGRHWWPAPAAIVALLAFIVSLGREAFAYAAARSAGRLEEFLATRAPVSEALAIIAALIALLLLWQLSRPSAHPEAA